MTSAGDATLYVRLGERDDPPGALMQIRKMLLFYWKSEILPALRQRHSELVRRDVADAG